MVKINFSEILYVESLSDYIQTHLTNKTITSRETVSNIEAKLPQHQFLRVHHSFIISINKIELFSNEFVELGNKAIPISRAYKIDVLKKLKVFKITLTIVI